MPRPRDYVHTTMKRDEMTYLWRWRFDPPAFVRAVRVGCAMKGWDNKALADAVGMPPASVWRWFKKEARPKLETCEQIAELLGLPFEVIIGYAPLELDETGIKIQKQENLVPLDRARVRFEAGSRRRGGSVPPGESGSDS